MSKNTEIEIRYLEVDVPELLKKLKELNAKDLGQDLFREIIFYDKDREFIKDQRVVRIRSTKDKILLAYKQHSDGNSTATEIELEVSDEEQAVSFLEKVGLVAFRRQEKRRHAFSLDGIGIDIDTWPKIPPYVELEGESEEVLVAMAKKLGLKGKMVVESAGKVIENYYNIPVRSLRYFTFDKVE